MDYSSARQSMVRSQIRPNQVNDEAVVAAMADVPREPFVPVALKAAAYADEDIPLGNGRFMAEPLVLARSLQAAAIKPHEVVLDIGCGPGYSAAVIARLASAVVAVESDARLAQKAIGTLAELGIDTVAVIEGELAAGYAKQAPFDVIVFEGAVSGIPTSILGQLAEGGRLVAVVKDSDAVGRAVLVERRDGLLARRELFDAAVPYLPGFEPAAGFVF